MLITEFIVFLEKFSQSSSSEFGFFLLTVFIYFLILEDLLQPFGASSLLLFSLLVSYLPSFFFLFLP
jgi:hypothetical protein